MMNRSHDRSTEPGCLPDSTGDCALLPFGLELSDGSYLLFRLYGSELGL